MGKITFVHQTGEFLPNELKEQLGLIDFAYSFDVFVHVDIHTLSRTLMQVHKLLKSGGMMMLSVANLCSETGYERFSK